MKIAVAGTGYVGLSIALLLSQHNEVHALDIVPKKVELLNNGKSPIVDPVITDFLKKNASGERPLNFHATVNAQEAYADVDFAIIATPTNYDEKKNYFDTSSVEAAITAVRQYSPHAWIIIKSTIPVGYTQQLRENLDDNRILFSPEFLREGHALYDNLHPSRIVVALRKTMLNPFRQHGNSPHCLPKVQTPQKTTVRIATAAPVSPHWWLAPPRPKPSSYSLIRIWLYEWHISMNLIPMRKVEV